MTVDQPAAQPNPMRLRADGGVQQGGTHMAPSEAAASAAPTSTSSAAVFNPESVGVACWEWCMIALALWSLGSLPWYFAYAPDDALRLLPLECLLDAATIADIWLRFRLAFPDRRGRMVVAPPQIARRYVRNGRFAIDVASIAPLSLVGLAAGVSSQTFALLHATRVLRAARLTGNAQLTRRASGVQRIGKLLCVFILFAHWMGAVFFLLSKLSSANGASGRWIDEAHRDIADAPAHVQFMTSFYWAMVGAARTNPRTSLSCGTVSPRGLCVHCALCVAGDDDHRRLRRDRARVDTGDGVHDGDAPLLCGHVRLDLRPGAMTQTLRPSLRLASSASAKTIRRSLLTPCCSVQMSLLVEGFDRQQRRYNEQRDKIGEFAQTHQLPEALHRRMQRYTKEVFQLTKGFDQQARRRDALAHFLTMDAAIRLLPGSPVPSSGHTIQPSECP